MQVALPDHLLENWRKLEKKFTGDFYVYLLQKNTKLTISLLLALGFVACKNDDDGDTPSRKSGQLVDYTFVKKDSFNDIIKAKEEAGDNESVKQLKELKNKFFENFKKDLKKKAVKHGVTLKCFEAACAAKHWKETGEDSDGYDFNGFEDDFFTVAAGYSQGGSVSLAIQNYIQNNDSDNSLRLKGALCGDGPYNPFATYSRYAEDDYQLWLPSVITLILRAYLYYYSASYKALKAALDANNMADPSKWNGSKNNKITAAMHWKVDEAVPYKNYESLTGNLTVKDKGWDPSQDSVLRDIIAMLSNLGITDSLDDVLQLFRNEPSGKASNGSHIAAGKLFFVGNLFYREDHLHMDD